MTTSKIAIIDIGSNSIRLVVYDELKRTPLPLHNEKVLCGLARGMGESGVLNEQGVELALNALGRFSELLKVMDIERIIVFATSAVRDAADGKNFVRRIMKDFDFDVKILSENEEAEYSSIGVMAAMDKVEGVVGDFGGGSLELTCIDYDSFNKDKNFSDALGPRRSFPIGALRLRSLTHNNKIQARTITDGNLLEYGLEEKLSGKNFYAVGGGFRALAKYHIDRTGYPLDVIHQYRVPAHKLLVTVKQVAAMTSKRVRTIPVLPSTRADTIPYTAIVLERIIEIGKPSHVIFSTHGVREGALASLLPKSSQEKDALLESVSNMMKHLSPGNGEAWVKFGHELYDWMSPLFRKEDDKIRRLRLAACILGRLAWHEHTAYQAEMAFRWVLDAAIPSIDHAGRVFVGTAVFHRYQTATNRDILGPAQTLLSQDMVYRAQVIGNAMRLGYAIAAGANGILAHTPLTLTPENELILEAKSEREKTLFTSLVRTRMEKLGNMTKLRVFMDNEPVKEKA